MTAVLAGLLVSALLALAPQQDSVRVSAQLSTDHIIAGESAVLDIVVETNGTSPASIRMPTMPAGLEILGSSDYSQIMVRFPGGRTRVTGRKLVLTGRVAGTFTIPSIAITVSGKTYRTERLSLLVRTGAGGSGRSGGSARVRLEAKIHPERAYVGQQVTYSAEAVFPRELRMRQTRPATYQAPNASGFWAQDLADQTVVGVRVENGEIVSTQTFRRAYFPIVPGRHVFPPARLGYEYRPAPGLPSEAHELEADSLVLTVLPLPEEGRPASFTGAVGRYTIRADVTPRHAAVGEAVSLSIDVRGTGNIKALPAPKLPELPGFDVFSPAENAEPDGTGEEVGGVKHFTWVLVPREPGEVTIPAVRYAFFDPATESYREVSTRPIDIDVTGESSTAGRSSLRPIRALPGPGRLGFVRTRWFLAAQAIPLVLLVASAFMRRGGRKSGDPRPVATDRVAFARLRARAPNADRDFYSELATTLRIQLATLLGTPRLGAAPAAELGQALEAAGVPRPTAAAAAELVGSLDRVRFAPAETRLDATATVDRAERLAEAVASALRRRQAGGGKSAGTAQTAVGLVLILAGAGLFAGGAAPVGATGIAVQEDGSAPAQDAAFETGLQAYIRGDFEAAAEAFARHVAEHPDDVNGWYDAGNAYYQAGRTGEAVSAWMRAVRLDPHHNDARSNLSSVAPAAEALLPTRFSLAFAEAALALAMLWWAAAAWVLFRRLRRKPAGAPPWVFAGLALVAVGGWAAAAFQPEAAVSIDEQAVIRTDPALKAETIVPLPPGSPVRVVGRRTDWLRVRTPAGVEGWVESSQLTEV